MPKSRWGTLPAGEDGRPVPLPEEEPAEEPMPSPRPVLEPPESHAGMARPSPVEDGAGSGLMLTGDDSHIPQTS